MRPLGAAELEGVPALTAHSRSRAMEVREMAVARITGTPRRVRQRRWLRVLRVQESSTGARTTPWSGEFHGTDALPVEYSSIEIDEWLDRLKD